MTEGQTHLQLVEVMETVLCQSSVGLEVPGGPVAPLELGGLLVRVQGWGGTVSLSLIGAATSAYVRLVVSSSLPDELTSAALLARLEYFI